MKQQEFVHVTQTMNSYLSLSIQSEHAQKIQPLIPMDVTATTQISTLIDSLLLLVSPLALILLLPAMDSA